MGHAKIDLEDARVAGAAIAGREGEDAPATTVGASYADALVIGGDLRVIVARGLFGAAMTSVDEACVTRALHPDAAHTLVPALRAALHGRDSLCCISIDGARIELRCVGVVENSDRFALAFPADTRPASQRREGLDLHLLGPTEVLRDRTDIGGPWLEQRGGQLLKLLAAERGRVIRTDEIIEALWPGSGMSALSNVRFTVHELRKRLDGGNRGERGAGSFVVSHRGGYRLDATRITVDADRFADLLREGQALLRAGDFAEAQGLLKAANALYRGDFLADEPYAEWSLNQREHFRTLAAEALDATREVSERLGDMEAAIEASEHHARLEPYDEVVHHRLIELCLRRGRRSEALRRFAAFETRLERDLGERPGFSIQSLLTSAA